MSGVERIESYLADRWQAGTRDGQRLVNPATEDVLATADTTGLDFALGLEFARNTGGAELRALTFAQRAELLQKMSAAVHEAREALIDASIANGGCTRSDAKFDVDGAIGAFTAYAEIGRALGETRVLADGEGVQLGRNPRFWAQHVYLPRAGAAVFINAFNFPAWGFAEKAACALLAGMPVVSKPATATALTAYRMTRVLAGAKILPPGALSFVGGAPGDLLDHLGGQDVVAFTGSADTARSLKARENLLARAVPVNVEADSLNAAVLGPDVELGSDAMELFLKDVARDMTQKTGQKCTAIRRVLLPADRADDVQAALAERLAAIRIGNPASNDTQMGPVATASQLRDVKAGVQRLREDADLVFGEAGRPASLIDVPADKGFFHGIALLRARAPAAAVHVHSHEVFGPVATVLVYSGAAEEAIDLVRKGEGGLVSSIYSDDREFLESMVLGVAPFHGRLYLGSGKIRDLSMGPGLVWPSCVHGGPGRAGAGEELGGLRGVQHFMQRTALQGYRPLVEKIAGVKSAS
jgi:oxepin-CoA hydrolase/3-oxo-5,6-dehydrosuberyl-CoA semialdehyde dehydrogenase